MLKQRIITAVILAPIVVAAILLVPATGFNLIALAIFTLAAWEWADLSGFSSVYRIVYALLFIGFCIAPYQLALSIWEYALWFAMAVWLCALIWVIRFPASIQWWGGRLQRAILGLAILIPAWLAMVYLKQAREGGMLVLMLLLIIWGADIGAYFSGRAWGKVKLAPLVSPGKTWAGALGGLASATLICWCVASFSGLMNPGLLWHWGGFGLLALITAAVSILGDLTVSMVKRHRGVKDSGNLLPGHGGLLDRIDSLVAGLPLYCLLVVKLGLS